MRRFGVVISLVLVMATLIVASAAQGQQQDPDTAVRLNLSTPGARSLAMGGAFLALADDATAAYTNPAGLTNLTLGGSQATLELRQWGFSNSFPDRGRISGKPTDIGVDSDDELLRDTALSETNGISFLSFAYVLPRGLTLAAYRHELANFETGFTSQGPFVDAACPEGSPPETDEGECRYRYLPRATKTALEIVNYGVSAAFELRLPSLKGLESTLSFGLGASYYQLELFAYNAYFGFRSRDRQPGGFYGPPDFLLDNLVLAPIQEGDDEAFGANVGFLWKLGRQQRWSVGGVYRQGPDFATEFKYLVGQKGRELYLELRCGEEPSPSCEEDAVREVEEFEETREPGSFHVPDVVGLGIAYRTAGGKTKLAFDFNRVRYSQRLVDFTAGLLSPDDPDFDPEMDVSAMDFRIEDADQLHVGLERIFLVVESLFVGTVRAGVWNEPFHELEYLGTDPTLQAFQRPTDDEIHFSVGLGLVIKEDYQVDLAADLSDLGDTYSFSLVKFF